ncbi:MAG: hypothetical protein WA705_22110 [Candidatus Ozemobacteraceae bacterium]
MEDKIGIIAGLAVGFLIVKNWNTVSGWFGKPVRKAEVLLVSGIIGVKNHITDVIAEAEAPAPAEIVLEK